MNDEEVLFPWVVAILFAGCLISCLYGDFVIWIPILLALAISSGVASSVGR